MSCGKKYCFSNVSIFKNLTELEYEWIAKMVQSASFSKGELILRAGDEKKKLFIVRNGRVKVEHILEDGNAQLLRFIEQEDFFGVTTLFHEEPLSVNVEALEATDICMIDGDQLKRLLMQKPVILMKIMEQFTKRMRTLEQRLSDISYKEVDARVANYLLKNTTKNQPSFLLNVSKKDLASMLGTTRESISRKLSEFQKMHYIVMDGQTIEIHNFDALKKIAMK